MLVFLLILITVITNTLLGCYVAILFGFGPPTVRTAISMAVDVKQLKMHYQRLLDRVSMFLPQRFSLPAVSFRKAQPPQDRKTPAAETTESLTQTPPAPPPAEEESFDEMMKALSETDVSQLIDDETEEISNLAPMQEIFDEELASVLMEQGTETWLVNEKHVETSILKLNVVMMKSGRFAAELDARIRDQRGKLTTADVTQFLGEMIDDCRNYLDSQAEITQRMIERLDEFGELKYLAEDVEYANMEQSAQIETTLSNLDHLNMSENPEEIATRLLKELSSLRIARHRLRDMQDRSYMKVSFYEDHVDTIPQQLYYDEQFGIRGRIGIEVALDQWWKLKRHQNRQITFALLDFVKFGEANEEHGIAVCDKVIRQFGRKLQNSFDATDLVGIYTGNCFFVATINAGLQKTITEIERIRQNCEQTLFRSGDEAFHLQLTCALTEVVATQTQEDALKMLDGVLTVAKRAGRNHTFQQIPGLLNPPPEKVTAPDMRDEPAEIDLNA